MIGKLEKDSYLQWINSKTMPLSHLASPQVIYINSLMHDLNSLNDDLYEALMDGEDDQAQDVAKSLVDRLQDVIQTLEHG